MAHIVFLLGSAIKTKGDREGKAHLEARNGRRTSTRGTDTTHDGGGFVMAAFPASWSPDMVVDG